MCLPGLLAPGVATRDGHRCVQSLGQIQKSAAESLMLVPFRVTPWSCAAIFIVVVAEEYMDQILCVSAPQYLNLLVVQ